MHALLFSDLENDSEPTISAEKEGKCSSTLNSLHCFVKSIKDIAQKSAIKNGEEEESIGQLKIVYLSYYKGVSEQLKSFCSKRNLRALETVFRNLNPFEMF